MTTPVEEAPVVCITGAGRGLGAALARAFASEGARLVLGARTVPEIEAMAAEINASSATTGSCAIAIPTDVRKVVEIKRLVEMAVAEFGRLDVMINNAGLAIYGPLDSVTEDEFDLMMDTNVKGCFFGSQAALAVMKRQHSGLIINISSIAGKLHLPGESAYNASKWAVNGFTGTLRLEAQRHGVRVSCVCPGGIDTPFWKTQQYLPFPIDHIDPQRDFMRPEDVANTVVELARTSDRYVVPEVVMVPLLPQL